MTNDKTTKNDSSEGTIRGDKSRPKRKTVYRRQEETKIPQYVQDHFAKDDYELRLVRWSIGGMEDIKNLSKREGEGYEFVDASELPQDYLKQLRIQDTRSRNGLVTIGDLCLMKADRRLRQSRRDMYEGITRSQTTALSQNLKKHSVRDDSRSKTVFKEPTFKD